MRILCVFQNIPDELDAIALKLAEKHTVFIASYRSGQGFPGSGIKRLVLKNCSRAKFEKNYLGYLDLMLKNARSAQASWQALRDTDNVPDLVLSCSTNGASFCLPQFFPESFLVSYADNRLGNLLVRSPELYAARKLTQDIQFSCSNLCFARFPCQKSGTCARSGILPLFVDTDFYAPSQESGEKIVVAGGSLREEEILSLCRLVVSILSARTTCSVLVAAENSMRRFPWEQWAATLPRDISGRIRVEYAMLPETWKKELLCSSFIYCPKPDAAIGRRLLEAMSCGKCILADSLEHACFQNDKKIPGLISIPSPKTILDALSEPESLEIFREPARQYVLKNHDQKIILTRHIKAIINALMKWRGSQGPTGDNLD